MANPQQPELARSRRNPALNPDATETRRQGEDWPSASGPGGPVPEENRPGHHPDHDQDKPDPADFVAKVRGRAAAATAVERTDHVPAPATVPPSDSPASDLAELVAAVVTAPLRALEKVLGALSRRV